MIYGEDAKRKSNKDAEEIEKRKEKDKKLKETFFFLNLTEHCTELT